MSATSLLPVELWLVILEHALHIYPFFSLDPAADYIGNPAAISDWLRVRGRRDEVFQQRLVLRQVCRTWCEFMDRPEIKHRFARLCDIGQSPSSDDRRSVEVGELLRARRIEGSFHSVGVSHEIAVIKQLQETAAAGGIFDVEILTNAGTNLTDFITKANQSAFPRLKSLGISAYRCYSEELFAAVSMHFPSMVFLSIKSSAQFDLSHGTGLQLSSLSTLIIESRIFRDFSLDDWSLPSLCHLQIGAIDNSAEIQRLITVLAVLGPQLRVLGITLRTREYNEDGYEGYNAQIISQIWNHFPNLEALRFPLYLILSHAPPPEHPIRYLTNSDVQPANYSWLESTGYATITCTDALVAFCLAAPGLAVLRESHYWTWAGPCDEDLNSKTLEQQDCCRHLAKVESRLQASNMRVRLEDVNGKTLGEI